MNTMIWIVSHHTSEISTEMVMTWIQHLGGSCRRVNGIDLLGPNSFSIEVNNHDDIHFKDEIDSAVRPVAWFRRWIDSSSLNENLVNTKPYKYETIDKLIRSEFTGLTNAFFEATRANRWFEPAPYIQPDPSKMAQLQRAKECGLTIPATIITNNKRELYSFAQKLTSDYLIIKPIKEIHAIISDDEELFATYTKILPKTLEDVPDVFFPSLFQEAVAKIFELRVFYFNNECHAMAIFSQEDEQTRDDFRRYNFTKPNRSVPYLLPAELVDKMRKFMDSFGMLTGSFDFLVDEGMNFYFLEVNPVGQFGMVSFPCNYYLEKEIAQHLIAMTAS